MPILDQAIEKSHPVVIEAKTFSLLIREAAKHAGKKIIHSEMKGGKWHGVMV